MISIVTRVKHVIATRHATHTGPKLIIITLLTGIVYVARGPMSRMSRVIYGIRLAVASILLCRRDGNGILQYSSPVKAQYLDDSFHS